MIVFFYFRRALFAFLALRTASTFLSRFKSSRNFFSDEDDDELEELELLDELDELECRRRRRRLE